MAISKIIRADLEREGGEIRQYNFYMPGFEPANRRAAGRTIREAVRHAWDWIAGLCGVALNAGPPVTLPPDIVKISISTEGVVFWTVDFYGGVSVVTTWEVALPLLPPSDIYLESLQYHPQIAAYLEGVTPPP